MATRLTIEWLGKIRSGLETLVDDTAEFVSSDYKDIEPGTPAANQLDLPGGRDVVETSIGIAGLTGDFCYEHISSLHKQLVAPIERFTIFTTTRAMLEPAARAISMVRPDISFRTRSKRVYAYRKNSLIRQLELNKKDKVLKNEVDKRLTEVSTRAATSGVTKIPNMSDATAVIGEELGLGSWYKIYSAIAHGQSSILMKIGYERIPQDKFDGDRYFAVLQPHVSRDALWLAIHHASIAYCRLIWRKLEFFQPSKLRKLEEQLERYADKLETSTKSNVRFWRSDN